ncbi:hypothetical protein MYSTI_06997 [Myxococcus stipitatus DSM 14675]|uniref:Uncharacterized protein n=1 Tax=Myxococcus stipitatus (strain DSM 14675 / JCM 12634 / Mx s8) TaxID=1278073 RepID=L7UP33_MYXSD|nr:hypothetical protein [Myxococcus stipitatus]AGC48269.1 hypothetical protein MYSTI_06997 [Myxococcus stipitatus DSM 14675]
MRTHFLKQLPISGREPVLTLEPDFDFFRAKKVLKLEVDFDETPEGWHSLKMELAYVSGAKRYRLGLLLAGVRELELPPIVQSLFLSELEIEDVHERMMEGVRFEVISHYERAFRCVCGDISILFFEPA